MPDKEEKRYMSKKIVLKRIRKRGSGARSHRRRTRQRKNTVRKEKN